MHTLKNQTARLASPRLAAPRRSLKKKEGQFSSAHSPYAFIPLRAFCAPEEIATMKRALADDPLYASSAALRKQAAFLDAWLDDPECAQIECVLPVPPPPPYRVLPRPQMTPTRAAAG